MSVPALVLASSFRTADWAVMAMYFAALVASGIYFSRRSKQAAAQGHSQTDEYFTAARTMPIWAVAISIIATSLSAATFIGAPQQSFTGDLTYLSTNIGGLIAVTIVAFVFIPVFYRANVVSIYELLEHRFGRSAKLAASGTFMLGRVFASGARIFIASIPLAIMLFGDSGKEPQPTYQLIIGIWLLSACAVGYTLAGGIASVIWTEVVQTAILLGAVIAAVVILLLKIPAPIGEIWAALGTAGVDGASKLRVIDLSWDVARPFSLPAVIIGFTLLNLASYGTDHDLVQRMLTCKNAVAGGRSVLLAIALGIPIVLLFLTIGLLLFVFYRMPQLMGDAVPDYATDDSRTVFLNFILKEMPPGLSGVMLAGLFAAGLSSLNSALNAMAATAIKDFYVHGAPGKSDRHYLVAGRLAVVGWGVVLAGFATFCVFWQRAEGQTLIDLALSVMNFAYAGLLAVFLTAILTKRGTAASAIAALAVGFVVITLLQKPVWAVWAKWVPMKSGTLADVTLSYPWHLPIAATICMLVCCATKRSVSAPQPESDSRVDVVAGPDSAT
jgi:SSS family transporter